MVLTSVGKEDVPRAVAMGMACGYLGSIGRIKSCGDDFLQVILVLTGSMSIVAPSFSKHRCTTAMVDICQGLYS